MKIVHCVNCKEKFDETEIDSIQFGNVIEYWCQSCQDGEPWRFENNDDEQLRYETETAQRT